MNKYERYGKQVRDRENEQTNPSYPLAYMWWINGWKKRKEKEKKT